LYEKDITSAEGKKGINVFSYAHMPFFFSVHDLKFGIIVRVACKTVLTAYDSHMQLIQYFM